MWLLHVVLMILTLLTSSLGFCVYEEQTCILKCSERLEPYDVYSECNFRLRGDPNCRPIKLRYTQALHDGTLIPKYSDQYYYSSTIPCIISLDISNDEHLIFPNLGAESQLEFLNISFNSLRTAKLSNVNGLPQLQEIDFSYNLIQDIATHENEYIFDSLQKLNLSYNNLVQIKEATFDQFSNIQLLDLSHNEISDVDGVSFEGIRKLVYLNLAYNNISDINGSLFRFAKLTHLYLNNNNIKYIYFKDFEKLTSLEEIDLSFNVILLIEKNVFNAMPLLSVIMLNNNELMSLDSQMFFNTSALNTIDLSCNEIRRLPKLLFYGKSVSTFDIRNNNIEGALTSDMFKGLLRISKLDFSYQNVSSIQDFAFTEVSKVEQILLNHNKINFVSPTAFNSLHELIELDLSYNQIVDIDGRFNDLKALRHLAVNNNLIQMIKKVYFLELKSLEYLDVSRNYITNIEALSFESLNYLKKIRITECPLTGALETNTFTGMKLVSMLDISNTSISVLQNSSFNQMTGLEILNISRSALNDIYFNAFFNTSALHTLDLSYNFLKFINFNTSALKNLEVLYLQHNFISAISSNFFMGTPLISTLNLSYNNLKNLPVDAFSNFKGLMLLDLSFNKEVQLKYIAFFEILHNLRELSLSGVSELSFNNSAKDSQLTDLNLAYSNITNVSLVGISHLRNLNTLAMNNNKIKTLAIGSFSNLTRLSSLDLSFNEIKFIQPGAFKDNVNLNILNISHNQISSLSYGVFRGLVSLSTLDISYNEIQDAVSERFHDAPNLRCLIIDYNRITNIDVDGGFSNITILSLGGNHIACEILVKWKKNNPSMITAIKLDENTQENVDGVTCYGRGGIKHTSKTNNSIGSDAILSDIRDILLSLSSRKATEEMSHVVKPESNLDKQLAKLITEQTSNSVTNANVTNSLLERILKIIVAYNSRETMTQLPPLKENATFENILPYLNKVKQDMENSLTIEKERILSDITDRIALINKKLEETSTRPSTAGSEKINNPFLFLNICVGLMLLTVLCFFTYKMYKCVISPSRRSYSTQNIVHPLDNSNL